MPPRSSFYHAMTCFFTTDQNTNQPKKNVPTSKTKSRRNTNILLSDLSSQMPSIPKRYPQITTAKPKPSKEIIDLTSEEDDPVQPIKIHILDETLNMAPITIHLKTDPLGDTTFNTNHWLYSNDNSPIKSEKTSENDVEILSLKEENIQVTDDSMSMECMSIENQSSPCKNDAPMLKQFDDSIIGLSKDDGKNSHCTDNQTCEMKKISIFEKIRDDLVEGKDKLDDKPGSCKSRKTNSQKRIKTKSKLEQFHASKIAFLSESNSYYCFLCEVSLKGKQTVGPHIQNDRLPRNGYKCSVCDQRFQWKGSLTRHLRQHFGTSNLESTMKSDTTTNDVLITKSTPNISGLNKTTEDADETFNNLEEQLKLNSNSTHSSLIKIISDTDRQNIKLTCGYCDQSFSSQVSLVEHCRTHMEGRPFICNICGTLFKQNPALVYHTRSHFHMIRSRKKKISAPFIRYVLRIHSCNDCDRSYISWSALNQHIINCHSATAERFVCDSCNQVFFTMVNLRNHRNKGRCRKKKRFHCENCSKSYSSKQQLRRHELKKH